MNTPLAATVSVNKDSGVPQTHVRMEACVLKQPGFFLEMYSLFVVVVFFLWGGGNCFCGERKCEKHPNNKQNFVVVGGEI